MPEKRDLTIKERAGAEKHLTVREFAEREGVPVSTVYQWNSRGEGPRYLKVGRHVRYRLADVLAWEAARCVGGNGAV